MAAVDGYGTTIAYGDGGDPEVFTDIANVTSIDVPALDTDEIDASAHDSPSHIKEFLPGWGDPGEASLELNYDPALHNSVLAMRGVNQTWRITFPDGSETEGPGYIKTFERSAPSDDKLGASVTIRATGVWNETTA